eukprot:13823543-Alexandrium_andersonii.AAC.1
MKSGLVPARATRSPTSVSLSCGATPPQTFQERKVKASRPRPRRGRDSHRDAMAPSSPALVTLLA